LVQCRQSDFNSINVNNYIALCYIKLGEYQKAIKAIDLVMKIDRSNKAALNHKKELIHFGVIKKEANHMILSIAIVTVLAMGAVGSYYLISKKDNVNTENNLIMNSQQEAEISTEDGTPDEGAAEQKLFTSKEIVSAIEGKDYEKLYSILSAVENSTLSEDEQVFIQKAVVLLSQGGMEYFYAKGLEAVESKDFNSAIGYFSKGFKYSQGSYKHSHYIYMLGLSYKNAGDIDSAIKYYDQYDRNYPSGDYEQTVLYELALIYKNIDDSTSKSYAKKLVKLYPKSIYNNSIIQGILSR
jgi:tetratricopeptide (TPR) repeat protein